MQTVDAIILGAGVAGLTAANRLLDDHADVLCLESFTHVGGNHRSRDIGGYTFDIGSIVLNSKFPLFRHFSGLEDICVPFQHRLQRVAPGGAVRAYPFELSEALGANPLTTLRNGASLIAGRLGGRAPGNVEDYCVRHLGWRLYRGLGLKTYIERFYGLPASEINLRFAETRMQFVAEGARLDQMIGKVVRAVKSRLTKTGPGDAPFSGLVRPRGGFEALYGAVQSQLAARGARFMFGVAMKSVRKANDGFIVDTDCGAFATKRVVSTIPVSAALALIDGGPERGLIMSDLMTLYISFAGARGFSAPVLYNFDAAGRWKRLTMHSDAYGRVDGREYFNVEIPFMNSAIPVAEDLFADFARHVGGGVFDGDLKLEGADVTPGVYPAYTVGSDALLERALSRIEGFGLETVGRQGRFDYLPTIGHVMSQVEKEMAAGKARRALANAAAYPGA